MPTQEMQQAAPPAGMLEQTRFFRAPRSRVYEAWTNPEILKQWFGNTGWHCPVAELDVRVGGTYRVEVHNNPDPADPAKPIHVSSVIGTYTQIVSNELLQFTWTPSWAPDEESTVTVTFVEINGGTELTIHHTGFADEASRNGHNQGWSGSLDKLAQLVSRS